MALWGSEMWVWETFCFLFVSYLFMSVSYLFCICSYLFHIYFDLYNLVLVECTALWDSEMWVWETFCSIVSLNQLTSPGILLHIYISNSYISYFLFKVFSILLYLYWLSNVFSWKKSIVRIFQGILFYCLNPQFWVQMRCAIFVGGRQNFPKTSPSSSKSPQSLSYLSSCS